MSNAIRVQHTGGPEVLELADIDLDAPKPHQVLIKVAAAGVNYIDVYQRNGTYSRKLPFTPGLEGSGTVLEVGSEVTGFAPGDRVAWQGASGSYAEQALLPAKVLQHVPDGVSDETAAALLLQGITAHALVTSTYPVQSGDTVLIHAAAGGVGLLLTQLAKAHGARVIGTVSTEDKAQLAREAGVDEVIRYDQVDFPTAVQELTNDEGVAVVYDGVGKSTVDGSLASLRRRGMLVLYGASSGPVPAIDPQSLSGAGSVFLTRPTSSDYITTPDELHWRVSDLFSAVTEGKLRVHIGQKYPLAEVSQAHKDLESRKTTGKTLLIP